MVGAVRGRSERQQMPYLKKAPREALSRIADRIEVSLVEHRQGPIAIDPGATA